MSNDKEHWDRKYREKGYQTRWSTNDIQPCLIDFFKKNKPKHCLDVGCGDGFQTNYISKFCYVDGLDISPEAIRLGKSKYPNVNFICSNFLDFNPNKKYDFIFDRGCFHSAEKHSSYTLRQYVDKMYNLIDTNGIWLSIIGSADRKLEENDCGPPRWSAKEIVTSVEPFFKIILLKQTYLETENIKKLAWSLTVEKRIK
jgi:SAM-dependent methyltransferase